MIVAQKLPKFKIFRRLKRIGCGCFLIFLLFILLGLIFSGVIIRKLISGAITQQTGIVQTNTDNKGQSFTDPKTGATINLGVNKIPDSFPKDFPIYPGATVSSSQTGSGFWLTLLSSDEVVKISTYYQGALAANAWSAIGATTSASNATSWAISKANLSGYLTIERGQNEKQTSILVVLGEVAK